MKRLAICIALAATTAQAEIAEEVVTLQSNGQDVVGTLTLAAGDPAPVVLLLHGFTGARDELSTDAVPAGVFAHTASRLAEAGLSSLRIDFRGSGESLADLTFADTTFEGQIADAVAAMKYLEGLETVDGDALHVIGWSQGGLVAAASAGRSGLPDKVALWNAVADPMQTYGTLFGADPLVAAIAAEADATVTNALPWGAEVALKGAFFDQVETFDAPAELAAFGGPVFVAQGSKDTIVDPSAAEAYLAAHEGPEEAWIAEMDHVFNVFAEGDTLDQMIDATIAFLK